MKQTMDERKILENFFEAKRMKQARLTNGDAVSKSSGSCLTGASLTRAEVGVLSQSFHHRHFTRVSDCLQVHTHHGTRTTAVNELQKRRLL